MGYNNGMISLHVEHLETQLSFEFIGSRAIRGRNRGAALPVRQRLLVGRVTPIRSTEIIGVENVVGFGSPRRT